MTLPKVIVGFVLRFAIVYGLLIVPWPGWNDTYCAGFRAMGNAIFGDDGHGARLLHFEQHEQTRGLASIDTRIVLGNRDLADASGKAPGLYLAIEPRSIGWDPTALTIALIFSTPLPRRRRTWALLWGLLLIHLFIIFSLWIYIWDASSDISLVTLSPFWKTVADELQYTLVTQLGISFTMPLLIWVLVLGDALVKSNAGKIRR